MKSPKPKKTPKSPSDPQKQLQKHSNSMLALTVFQNAPDYCGDPTIPLSTCLPAPVTRARMRLLQHAEALSRRRSPRLNSAPAAVLDANVASRKRKWPPDTAAVEMEDESLRRRSPRFSTPAKWQGSRGPELPLNADLKDQNVDSKLYLDAKPSHLSFHKETKPFKNSHGKFFGEKHLRQCPGLNPSCEAYAGKHDVKLSDKLELRRSPRLSSSNGSENTEIKPIKKSHGKLFGEKHLRQCPGLNPSSDAYAGKLDVKLSGTLELELRRSPRLSSSDGNENIEIKPIKNSHGKIIGEKHLRQCPGLNPCEAHAEKLDVELYGTLELRESPRLSSTNVNENMEIKPIKISHAKFFGEKHLRKSPGLNPSSEAYAQKLDVKLYGTSELRRSPRLSSSNGNENMEINVLQGKRTSKVVHQKKKNTKVIFTSIELSNSPVEQHTCGVNDTKYLTSSSEATTSPSCTANGITTSTSLALPELNDNPPRKKYNISTSSTKESMDSESIPSFIGDPIPDDEAQKRWGWRYELKDKKCKDNMFKINEGEEDEIIANVKCHYARAEICNCIFSLGDCAFIKGEGEEKHIGKIIEFFQTTNGQNYFRVQWFYRIQDTVVQDEGAFHDKRRVFYSSIMNDNLIDCIIGKANVTKITPRVGLKLASISPSDFYYDMEYCVEYSTFRSVPTDNPVKTNELSPPTVLESLSTDASTVTESLPCSELYKTELALLDLYSGCGGMSTGLCLGAITASVNLVTRWAVDSDRSASESLKLNHPDTHVRNESVEDFLELLKEWEKLCKWYNVNSTERKIPSRSNSSGAKKQGNSEVHDISDDELEVSKLVDICFGDPNETGKRGLYLKVHWKGYSSSEDTWEPIKSLSKCKEGIQDFVRKGMKSKILPLPGEVDVICGGPPCQGISGYNRFRNSVSPWDDERNRQIMIFMDMVKFLKPKYVLMENVVDILRFDKGSLGRYALSRLVHMNYQARLGIIAAGCYGLPQFRLRVFLWGAHPSEVIPQFPLPTHDVIVRYWPPPEFERNVVAYDEDQPRQLEKATVIQDAISDLPAVLNAETRDEMPYQNPPETVFQSYIRSTKYEMTGSESKGTTAKRPLLYDHRPHFLFEDDYLRVCQIPKRKGANFRDLPGVIVGDDNVVRRHPTENPLLPSGKPLVPDYCFTFEHGKSKRPFARLWWDENLPTALTFPSCHSQIVLHPEQDRVLTIREFARLQGFPDYYRFYGTVKERYCQIGNAVAVPVSRALGYALGLAYRKLSGNEPLVTLPPKFSHSNYLQLSNQPGNTVTSVYI